MDEQQLLRQIAAEFGPDVLRAAEHPMPPTEATRALGLSDAMLVGSFLAACLQLAVQVWQARQDRALLVLALAEGLDGKPELASRLDPERRLGLIARVVNAITPERFGSSPSISAQHRSKQDWLTDWTGYGDKARAMTQPILVPFADMDNWIVYRTIQWNRPANASSSLPGTIIVPQGFVSDLATIPQYFWWALPPTGRYGHAAILHDWLYWEQSVSRSIADKVFEVAMAELSVELPLRKAMWAAVRVGGGQFWNDVPSQKKRGESRILKRFPETPVPFAEWKTNPDVFA